MNLCLDPDKDKLVDHILGSDAFFNTIERMLSPAPHRLSRVVDKISGNPSS